MRRKPDAGHVAVGLHADSVLSEKVPAGGYRTVLAGAAFGRVARLLLVLCLLLPALTACTTIRDRVGGVLAGSGGTLRLAAAPPETLDPAVAQDVTSWTYLLQIYSGLVRLNDKLEVEPDIAKSWTVSNGGRTYTFSLRDNARFQDGQPITAQDFKYSLERALDPRTRSPVAATYLGDIVGASDRLQGKASSVSGIVVIDAHTLQITIDSPKTYFLSKLTYPTAFVVDQRNVESGASWYMHPNGSGPFMLKSWQPNQQIVLVRNPNYYRSGPTLNEVDYYIGPQSALSLYQQGKLDVAPVGVGDIARVTDPQNPLHDQLKTIPQLSFSYIGFNVHQKPFDDPKVRLAFAYATNKKALVNGLLRGSRTVANGVLPPGLPGHDPSFTGIPFDPAEAKRLIAESSYRSVDALPPIVLSVPGGSGQVAEAFATMYHQTLGVTIQVVQLQNTFFDDLAQHRVQMFFLGWAADYPDPQDFVDLLFNGSSPSNETGYDSPKVDDLLARAAAEPDTQRRLALYREAEKQIIDDCPVIPLYFDTEYDLVRPSVKGLQITPMGIVSLDGVRIQG